MGRPPATRFSYVDCEFPVDEEEFLDENGDRQPGCKYTTFVANGYH